ncbi:MAG: hypothetical protein RL653_4085 [Pseudomonadota bacterium]|jgi:hypothetical protein
MTLRVRLALSVLLSVLSVGCSTPLSLRRAQVLDRGQAEVMVSPQFQVGFLADRVKWGWSMALEPLNEEKTLPGGLFGWGELSARFGVADRMDLQLRVDPSLLPEVAVGYQLLGKTGVSATRAATVTAGIKVGTSMLAGRSDVVISIPLQFLYDIPLGEHVVWVTGLRIIPNVSELWGVAPGAVAALSFGGTGAWRFQPEAAVSANFVGLGTERVQVLPSFTVAANFSYVFGAGQ